MPAELSTVTLHEAGLNPKSRDKSSQRSGHVCVKVLKKAEEGRHCPGSPQVSAGSGAVLLAHTPRSGHPGPPTETMHPLTNCFEDAAVLVLGPIQRGHGRHHRLGQPFLEKMPNKTCHGQQHQAPGQPGNTHPTEAGPQQRTQGLLGPARPAPELGSSDPGVSGWHFTALWSHCSSKCELEVQAQSLAPPLSLPRDQSDSTTRCLSFPEEK